MLISDNGVSKVWREGDWVYKSQPKFMTDNEIWCLSAMFFSGYVPFAQQLEIELIRTVRVKREPISDVASVNWRLGHFLLALAQVGIRHGDLTEPNIIINDNGLFVVDWSESRLACDPRPDKRPEGDEYWLRKTITKMIEKSK